MHSGKGCRSLYVLTVACQCTHAAPGMRMDQFDVSPDIRKASSYFAQAELDRPFKK